MLKSESDTFTREDEPYAYYKIIRIYDGYTSYCTILSWIETYFQYNFGIPDKWVESEEKTEIKVHRDIIRIPLWIKASIDEVEFDLILSKQDYTKVQLKIDEL